jgi:uncharacterized protein (TIGR02099 family)
LGRTGRVLFHLIPLWSWRLCFYSIVAAMLLVGSIVLGLRYWLLPNAEAYRGDVEAALSKATGQRITIGSISGDWQGWHPQLSLGEVTLYDKAGRAALTLDRIDQSLSWLTLLFLEPRFYSLEIKHPQLTVRRLDDGRIVVAGIDVGGTDDGGGLSDWLLRQREVVVRRATITWIDEKLQAPPLPLEKVTLRLQNDFGRHRFGLRADAPAHLAAPLDVRGDFQGGSIKDIRQWEGKLFAQLEYADLAAWKQWIPMPFTIERGTGALRVWLDFADERVTGVMADVRLAGLHARLGEHLHALELDALYGRIGWRGWKQGYELFAQPLVVQAADESPLPAAEVRLRRRFARADKPASGELKANALELEPLARIVDQLPIEPELRNALNRYALRGSVHGLFAKWSGDWPPEKYEVRAGFSNLGVNETATTPGLVNLSGSLEANERRGTLRIANQGTSLELTKVFTQPVAFDELNGQVSWTVTGDEYDIRLSAVSFANADVAGTLQGSYVTNGKGRGIADLTGALHRADVRKLPAYLPVTLGKSTRDWLATSLVSGRADEVRLRLKGDLKEFPFERPGRGIFEVKVRGKGGVLEYANGWPRIENIEAEVAFVGNRMEIRAPSASILGAQLTRVTAVIPDLANANEVLEVSGEAEGPTADFLRFIAESPVAGMIERFTDGMQADGRGRLALKLTLPLRDLHQTRVAGSYQFVNNQLRVDADLPPLEQVNGRLEFSESAVRGTGIAAQLFGGAASINVATQSGAVVVAASGRANLDQVRGANGNPWLASFSGSTDWRCSLNVRAKLADFVFESSMVGVTSSLPPPLAKAAGDEMPLRFQRQIKPAQHEQIDWTWGNVVAGSAVRRRDGPNLVVESVAIGVGTEPPAPQGPGVWVRGALPSLDVDRWRSLLTKQGPPHPVLPQIAGVEVKVGTLDAFGRRFNDFSAKARQQAGAWQATLAARELSGEVSWQPQDKGRLTARLARLTLPPSLERIRAAGDGAAETPSDYPALDLVVEDFQYKAKSLGRLELLAVPDGRNWRIDRLQIRNADGIFTADGNWQWQDRAPRTQLNVNLEVTDMGKFLVRLGYPEGVRGSSARLSGAVNWSGAPQEIDFPTLGGQIAVDAGRGQFVKLEPGIGKLLSILSLQALPRRVTLDFKDVFSEGFTFDDIHGVVKLQRGVGTTDGFRINGSAAKVSMSGEVDFTQESQKLKVRVTPSLGDSVATVTALLGGPVAGLSVFLAQKLLNDPFGQFVAYDYAVTGTWNDPHVTKIQAERVLPEPS